METQLEEECDEYYNNADEVQAEVEESDDSGGEVEEPSMEFSQLDQKENNKEISKKLQEKQLETQEEHMPLFFSDQNLANMIRTAMKYTTDAEIQDQLNLSKIRHQVATGVFNVKENKKLIDHLQSINKDLTQKLCIEAYRRSDVEMYVNYTGSRINVLNEFAEDINTRVQSLCLKQKNLENLCDETETKMHLLQAKKDDIEKCTVKLQELQLNKSLKLDLYRTEIENKHKITATTKEQLESLQSQTASVNNAKVEMEEHLKNLSELIGQLKDEIHKHSSHQDSILREINNLKDEEQKLVADFEQKLLEKKHLIESIENNLEQLQIERTKLANIKNENENVMNTNQQQLHTLQKEIPEFIQYQKDLQTELNNEENHAINMKNILSTVMKYRKENYYIVAVNTLQLLKDLNAKKIDLIHIEADQQNAAKTKTENNDSMVKLQQNIKDLELKFAEQKTEFDRDFALLNQQLQENNQEKEKILQTLLEIKPTKDKMLSWKRLRIKDKTEAMTRLKQEIETENNTATIKQEELEIKIRLLQKLENEKASLEKEYDTCFESVVNVKQSIVTVTGMNKPTTSILKRPMISPPSFLPKKKVTFPDLSSQTSSEGSVPVPQPQCASNSIIDILSKISESPPKKKRFSRLYSPPRASQ